VDPNGAAAPTDGADNWPRSGLPAFDAAAIVGCGNRVIRPDESRRFTRPTLRVVWLLANPNARWAIKGSFGAEYTAMVLASATSSYGVD